MNQTIRSKSVSTFYRALWAIAIFILLCHIAVYYRTMVDDAFITFRYSDNLARGFGPVYNPGERVEGITNFLWMALLTPPAAFGWNLVTTTNILGIICTFICIIILIIWSRSVIDYPNRLWVAFLFACSAPIAVWTTGGLETPLFVLLVLAGVIQGFHEEDRNRSGWWSGILFVFAAMTRPEGVIFWAGFVLFRAVESLMGTHPWRRSDWQRVLGFLVLAIPFTLSRWLYYGDIVPNTFFVKTGRGLRSMLGGARYTLEFLSLFGGGALICIGMLSLLDSAKRRWMSYCLGLSAVFVFYIIFLSGADWMAMFRYYVPIIPLLILPIAKGFELLHGWVKDGKLTAGKTIPSWIVNSAFLFIGASIVLLGLMPTYIAKARDVKRYGGFDDYRGYLKAAEYLKTHAPSDALIAVQNAGTIPYLTRLPTLDMSGLADKHIARSPAKGTLKRRYDSDYVLSRKPDYVEVLTHINLEVKDPKNPDPGIHELIRLPEFQANYQTVPDFSGPGVALFQRIHPEASGQTP